MDSADTIGAGNQPSAIARLLATYRSMESDVQVFLDNIILASIRILAQVTQLARSRLDPSSLPEDLVRWRVFTLSRVRGFFSGGRSNRGNVEAYFVRVATGSSRAFRRGDRGCSKR